jgi:hypothetical protein
MRLGRVLVGATLLVGMLAAHSAFATTQTVTSGTVDFQYAAGKYTGPEMAQYIQGGCAGNFNNAVLQAVVNLSSFQGRTIRVTVTGADVKQAPPGVFVWGLKACDYAAGITGGSQPVAMDQVANPRVGSPDTFVAHTKYVVVTIANPETAMVHYLVEAL